MTQKFQFYVNYSSKSRGFILWNEHTVQLSAQYSVSAILHPHTKGDGPCGSLHWMHSAALNKGLSKHQGLYFSLYFSPISSPIFSPLLHFTPFPGTHHLSRLCVPHLIPPFSLPLLSSISVIQHFASLESHSCYFTSTISLPQFPSRKFIPAISIQYFYF